MLVYYEEYPVFTVCCMILFNVLYRSVLFLLFVEVRKTKHKYIVAYKKLVSSRSWVLQVTLLISINWNNYIGVLVEMPSFESDSTTIALRRLLEKLGLAKFTRRYF